MTNKPLLNALIATLYIVTVVLLLTYVPKITGANEKQDNILAPIAMLSLLVVSVAMMAYIFFFQPIQMYLDGDKRGAVSLFTKTLLFFAIITLVVFTAAFIISYLS